jgi:hypothetical protein
VRHTSDLSVRLLPPLLRFFEGMLGDRYYFKHYLGEAGDAADMIRWNVAAMICTSSTSSSCIMIVTARYDDDSSTIT